MTNETDTSEINNEENKVNENCISLILTNARSLAPKINSMLDMIRELRITFMAVTETWFKGGTQLRQELGDIEQATGVKIICKNRVKSAGPARGGGVAFAFDTAACNFKERKVVSKEKHEILCVTGTVGKIKRKVVVFVIYVPPNTTAGRLSDLNDVLGEAIAAVKISHVDPILFVTGDLNGRDIQPDVRAPLETEAGTMSDHGCVHVEAVVPTTKNFTWTKRTVRKRSDSANERFAQDLRGTQWNFGHEDSPDQLVHTFEGTIAALTETHFPLHTIRARSNEDPWITIGIRRRAKRKKRLYRRTGRSKAWKRADLRLEREVAKKKQEFVDMLADAPDKSYFAAVKKLSGHTAKKPWEVTALFPDVGPGEVGSVILDYFSSIGGNDPPSAWPHIPPDGGGGMGDFTRPVIEKLLRSHKRVKSKVDGDPPPHLVHKFPDLFAAPVATIFDRINRTTKWPSSWKREHLTIIPKNPRPGDLSECRNISCTALMSKVLEGVLLEKLRGELRHDPAKYGGAKGCGAKHMIMELWDKILDVMDNGDKESTLRRRSTGWTMGTA